MPALGVYAPYPLPRSCAIYHCLLHTVAPFRQEIPETAFKTLEPDSGGVDEAAGKHPSSVRDIVWNGVRQDAIFHLLCLPGAAPETVDCGVCITEGIRSWRLSFRIEVEPEKLTTETSVVGNRGAKNEVESTSEELGAGRAEGGVSEPTISGTERVSGIQTTMRMETLYMWDMS